MRIRIGLSRALCLLACLLMVTPHAWSQSDRGTISGVVTDATGAMLSDISVVAKQVATGIEFKADTNSQGFYTILEVPIGTYRVTFSKAGFKDTIRTDVLVQTQHTVPLNVSMTVGAITESVTVSGTPTLEIQTEVGTNLNAQQLTDMPLSVNGGRDITSFAFAVTPNVSGSSWSSNIGGSQAFTKSVMIDGTSTDSGVVGQIAESEPSMDAIQETQVNTTGLRAEDGRSGGGAFMYELKSGSDSIHGSAFNYMANEFLNANSWDNKWWLSQCAGNATCEAKYRRAKNRFGDWGFSAGGPVWKKRKMYIFGAWEKFSLTDWRINPTGGTVPTSKMLTGDFSELLTAAATAKGTTTCPSSPCAIMNGVTPFTDGAGNTIYYGSIFDTNGYVVSGNKLSSISTLSQKIVSIYQKSYQPTVAGAVSANYPSLSNNSPLQEQNQLSFKYDWVVTPNDHIVVSYIYNMRPRDCTGSCGAAANSVLWQAGTHDGGPLTHGQQQKVTSNDYRGSETHTFSPTMVNVLAFTFNQFQNKSIALTGSTNWPTQLGLNSVDPTNLFPYITFGGSPNGMGETAIGNTVGLSGYVAYNGILNETLSWTKGRHSLKFGAEYRALGFNSDNHGGALTYNFSNTTFAPTNSLVQPYVGFAFANFLQGQVQSASQGTEFNLDSRRKELAFFAQDDIHITPRLNVSADIRWELTGALHVLPIKGLPGAPWSNFDTSATSKAFFDANNKGIKGAITWLNSADDSFETYTDWHQIAPHLGASYQITPKLVARASAGINFVPVGWNGYSGTPYGSAVGYSGTNQVNKVSDQAAAFQWDAKPYPGTYIAGTGPAPTSTYVPWGPASIDPRSRQLGMTENFFAGLQYELRDGAKLEVSYMSNIGRNLHDGALNPLNFPTWSTYQPLLASGKANSWVWDSGSASSNGVPYPYQGFSAPAYAALNPFPQVYPNAWSQIAFTDTPIGKSGYNAITVEGIKQRGSLNFDLSYNWSRSTGNTGSAFFDTWTFSKGYQDPYKYNWEAHWPHTNQQVKGYFSYTLPLGKGRRYLNQGKILDYGVGGWTAATVIWYGNGGQMGAIGSSNWYPGWSGVYTNVATNPDFSNKFKGYKPGWNPTVAGAAADPNSLYFNPSNFSNPTYGQLGNSPSVFSNWRGWSNPQESLSMLKKTKFGAEGRFVATLRVEFFDVFNRHYWGSPNTNISSAYFGHVTGVSGYRWGQFGARFEW